MNPQRQQLAAYLRSVITIHGLDDLRQVTAMLAVALVARALTEILLAGWPQHLLFAGRFLTSWLLAAYGATLLLHLATRRPAA